MTKETVYKRRFINASLAAGATETFQEDRADLKEQYPNKNFLAVHNWSGETIEIHVDGRTADDDTEATTHIVHPGASPVLIEADEDGEAYGWITIENRDSTNTSATGEIIVIMKTINIDGKRLLGNKG